MDRKLLQGFGYAVNRFKNIRLNPSDFFDFCQGNPEFIPETLRANFHLGLYGQMVNGVKIWVFKDIEDCKISVSNNQVINSWSDPNWSQPYDLYTDSVNSITKITNA